MNLAAKEAGLLKPVSVDRIKREEKQAFYSFLHKLSDKDIATLTKPIEPVLRTADREALVYSYKNYYGMTEENAQKRADEYIATQNKANEEKMLKYQKDLAFYEQNKDKIPRAKAVFQRYGVLSDFIAGATKGNISPYESGYWGHPASYWKSKSAGFGVRIPGKRNGVEPWAEYVACKMTKDEEGISIFREYLPKTFAKYEEVYAKMGGLLNERRP